MSEEVVAPVEVDTGQAAAPETWTSGFNDDLKGYVENKGFQDPAALADSYRNLEKLRGVPAEQLVQFPVDLSDREQMLPVYAKMGMPESPEGYNRALPEEFDSGVYNSLAEQAHALGLGDGQFQGLQQTFAEQTSALMEKQEEQSMQEFDAWKNGNAEGFQQAARVMAEVGVSEEQLEGVLNGDKSSLYDFLAKVGGRTGESPVVLGDPSGDGFSMSPQAAKTKISELMGDETFMKSYTSSSKGIRESAINRMEELQKIASA